MNIIKWEKSFETGFDVIDFQHKIILSRGNELIEGVENGKSKIMIDLILKDLIDYLFEHFTFEEQMFSSIVYYKDMDKHLQEHQYFRDKLVVITNKFLNNEKDISEEIMIFFNEWTETHILKTDKIFSKELKKHLKFKKN